MAGMNPPVTMLDLTLLYSQKRLVAKLFLLSIEYLYAFIALKT
jgi:hypothetical protein